MSSKRRTTIAIVTVFGVLTACAMPEFMNRPHEPTAPSPDTFKVLTYNTLHGLEVGRFWVWQGESRAERSNRFHLTLQHLRQAQPDIILLQEVNPLPQMAEDYVQALQGFGLSYEEIHQVDACGLDFFDLGLVPGLNNGLVILAKEPLRIRKLAGVKLSGSIGGCADHWGIQFGELRYAVIAEVTNPVTDMSYLVATAHLHSGIERDAHVLHQLMEAHRQGRLHHYEELMHELVQDQVRRLGELHRLMDVLEQLQTQKVYAGVIIGGDFNFEPGSPEYIALEEDGFADTHQLAMPDMMLHTYDPLKNPLAVHEEATLPHSLRQALAAKSRDDQETVIRSYHDAISMPRRIDFLFSMSFMSQACLMQSLFGQVNGTGMAGSDHYGILNTYSYRRMPCRQS